MVFMTVGKILHFCANLPVEKIIVVCGCIWTVALIKNKKTKKKLATYGEKKRIMNYELNQFILKCVV